MSKLRNGYARIEADQAIVHAVGLHDTIQHRVSGAENSWSWGKCGLLMTSLDSKDEDAIRDDTNLASFDDGGRKVLRNGIGQRGCRTLVGDIGNRVVVTEL